MTSHLSCGFDGQGSGHVLDHETPVLTGADPCNWHGCGTYLDRRQSATMAAESTDQARVSRCTPPACTTLPMQSTRASRDGRHALPAPESSAQEARLPHSRTLLTSYHLC